MNEQETTTGNELAIPTATDVIRRQQAVAKLREASGSVEASNLNPSDSKDVLTRLKVDTNEMSSLFKSMNDKPLKMDVFAIIVKQVQMTIEDTGEVVQALRTVFITSKGELHFTHSKIVAQTALSVLMHPNANRPFNPPLKCEFLKAELGPRKVALLLSIDGGSLDKALATSK